MLAGALAQKPRHGGHAWVLLQYLLGFKRLGWDVLFLDRLLPSVADPPNEFLEIMYRFGLENQFALLRDDSSETVGLSRTAVVEKVRDSAVFLNVMGFISDPEVLGRAERRVFLDIDPGFPQMWTMLGLYDSFTAHNAFVTIAANVGQADCAIPTCGRDWITTVQPVVLARWPTSPSPKAAAFTSVVTWRGANGPVEYEGKTYGLRVHEFRAFAELPRITAGEFELALDIHPSEIGDLKLLRRGGWWLVDPVRAAGDPCAYQTYIQRSAAEFMVAKNMYVATRSGWFSDRSICYLASGKPVLIQDTGLAGHYPVGAGLLTFSSLEGARDGVKHIIENYSTHASQARRIAEQYFDSDRVLTRLLSNLGVM